LPTEIPKTEEIFRSSETAAQSAFEERWADLPDGRMRYLHAGVGRPLILIHGLMGYSFSWRFTLPALAQHAECFAIDSMGAGFSVAPEKMDCSMTAQAERVLQFVDALGLTEYDLLGTSHGGAVAMLTAAFSAQRSDSRLKRLILVAPVNPWSRHGRRLAPFVGSRIGSVLLKNTVAQWRVLDYVWLRRMFGDRAKIPPDSVEGYRKPVIENRAFHYGQQIVRTWLADLDELEGAIATIGHYPTLLMWGTRDRAVSYRSAGILRHKFRDCQLITFKGVGHLPYEEAAEEFNRALMEFIRV
jgi:pimeloyl-ACP methyl ester carboxylesterase